MAIVKSKLLQKIYQNYPNFYKKDLEKFLDIILKEYWYDVFKRSIITELHEYKDQFKRLRLFMINHFYKCRSNSYDKQLLYYYKNQNKFLKFISNNKALSLFLLNLYPDIRHILKSEYLKACYKLFEIVKAFCCLVQ